MQTRGPLAAFVCRHVPSLRAVGGDINAAEVAGVRANRVLISAFGIGGAVAGFGGGLQAYALISASSAVSVGRRLKDWKMKPM